MTQALLPFPFSRADERAETFTGETTLFGQVAFSVRSVKHARLLLGDGTRVELSGGEQVLEAIKSRAGLNVGLSGTATWDAITSTPLSLRVSDVIDCRHGQFVKPSFDQAAIAAGARWDDVDAETFMASIRDTD